MEKRISTVIGIIAVLGLLPVQSARADTIMGQDGGQIRVSEQNGVISAEYWCLAEKPILKLHKCEDLGSFTKEKFEKTLVDMSEFDPSNPESVKKLRMYHGRPHENSGLAIQGSLAVFDFFAFFSGNFPAFVAGLCGGKVAENYSNFMPLKVAVAAAGKRINNYSNTKKLETQLKHDIAWLNAYKLSSDGVADKSGAVAENSGKILHENVHRADPGASAVSSSAQ